MGFYSSSKNVLSHPRSEAKSSDAAAWALVTGATTGIGRDIAHELCSRGFNVVIHGRNATRLDELCSILQTEYGVKAEPLVLDASMAFGAESDASTRKRLAQLATLDLRVLINNVGTGHAVEELKQLEQQSADRVTTLLNVNVTFMTHLTQILLPTLKRHATAADPSFVINAGSLGDIGLPYLTVYSGTKAYVRAFSRALDIELAAEGSHVRVVASIIGDTDSDGHRVGTDLFTPGSRDMARIVIQSAAGSTGGAVVPYWGHWVQEWMCSLQPYWLLRAGMIIHFKGMLGKLGKKP